MYFLQFAVITLIYSWRRVIALDTKQNLTILQNLLRMQLSIFNLKQIETLVDTICYPSCRIVVVSAQGWGDPPYYPDYPNYQSGYHHHQQQQHSNTQQSNYNHESSSSYNEYHQHQDCECKRLKDCPEMMEKVYQSNIPQSEWMLANLRDSHCGYNPVDTIVCCAKNQQPGRTAVVKSTTEKPWIWDITQNAPPLPKRKPNINFEQSYERWDHTQFNKFTATTPPKVRTKHNNQHQYPYKEDDYHFNLIDFEDPDTHKNCPPSFNDEFEAPNSPPTQKRNKAPNKTLQNRKPGSSTGFRAGSKPPARRRTQNQGNQMNQINGQNQKINNRMTNKRLVNGPYCGVSVNTRIVGGREIAPGQFPWMARLAYRNRTSGKLTYRCAGSVISDRYIVTAAHCVTNLVSSLEVFLVRVGELDSIRNLNCESNPVTCVVPQDYDIQKIIPHAQYDTPKYANDIALIRLVRPVNATEIIPICLPIDELSSADRKLTGKIGIIAGWGSKTTALARQTPSLQYVTLPIVNRTKCAASYAQFSANSRTPIIVSQAQICAQGMENMDACQGDSGGPLMVEGTATNARFTLLGLVSFGPRTCGVSNFPGVYTRISSYIDWIVDNME